MRILLIWLSMITSSLASPFLVCNPYPPVATGSDPTLAVSSFQIFIDGSTTPVSSPAVIDASGNQNLHFDLASLAKGNHTVTAAAVNQQGGVSAQSLPLSFTLGIPGVPQTLKLSPN